MATLIRCDQCNKKISIADDFQGRAISCPRCGETVRVRGRSKRDPEDSGDDKDRGPDDREERRRRPGRKKQPNLPWLWIGLGAGGVFLFLVVGVVIVVVFVAKNRVAQKNVVTVKPAPGPANPVGAPGGPMPGKPADAKVEPVAFPELGRSRLIQPGIQFQEAALQRGNVPMKVWYYRPQKATGKLPLILVPPAGSTLIAGMDLGEGDRPEHYPYARAGFAVASFEIDGPVPERAPDAVVLKGAREFRDSQAGIANARTALDFILAKVPDVDPNRVYIAGHSSAATLALLFAEHEPRIKGCAAYAAVTDVESRVAVAIPELNRALPGYGGFLRFSSPKTHADKLKCPLFLFHAQDDNNVPVSQTTNFAAQVKQFNSAVTLVITPTGGHYDSMVREGVPKGITWLQNLK